MKVVSDPIRSFEIVGLGAGRHHVSAGRWKSSVVMPGDGEQHELDIELPAPAPDPVPTPLARNEPTPSATPTATLTGRVLLEGAPVPRFAIVRKGLAVYRWTTDPTMVHAPDGRFALTELRERSCTVHVLGLGSAWTSTPTLDLEPGSTLDLGDIVLERGLRIAGTVCSAAGEPISGAFVTIGSPFRDDDALHDAVDGYYKATSGSDGAFVLDGIHLRDAQIQLAAHHPMHGASLHQSLSGIDETLRLVLVPTGGIDGQIEPHATMHGGVIVRANAADGGSRVAIARPSGFFAVDNLVPGDYVLELVERPGGPPRVARATVVAGQRTIVRMPPS